MQQGGLAIAWTDICSLATRLKRLLLVLNYTPMVLCNTCIPVHVGYAGGRVMPDAMKPSNSLAPLPIVYTLYSNLKFSI
jgi:hypothetical protein